jgi:hypothetical protein
MVVEEKANVRTLQRGGTKKERWKKKRGRGSFMKGSRQTYK